MSERQEKLRVLRNELTELDWRRGELVAEIRQVQNEIAAEESHDCSEINIHSPEADKIRLFRDLFAGRTNVFPIRFESRGTGLSARGLWQLLRLRGDFVCTGC